MTGEQDPANADRQLPSSESAAGRAFTVGCERRPITPAAAAWFVALVGWTALLSFYDLDGGAGLEPVDAWVAQTAREMSAAETWHDRLVPRFCDEARVQKSPGAYWAVCLTSHLRGGPVDEVAVRIPNAIAALVLVATIFWLTRRIAGDRAAIFAGFAAASSVMILHWSHAGSSDLGMTTLITLSLACVWIGSEAERPGWKRTGLWLAGYLAAGLGMLYKMPMPLACVGIPAVLYVLLRNRWRMLANWWHLVGLALFLLPWLPWVLTVLAVEPNAFPKWRTEYWDRLTGAMPNVEAQKQWFFYLLYVGVALLLSVPYSLSVPRALVRAFRRQAGVHRNGMLFVAIWFLSLLAFFTVATGKETRYLLPAMPPLFIMLGVELARFFDPDRRVNPRRDRIAFWAVVVLVPASLVGLGFLVHHQWYLDHHVFDSFEWRDDVLQPYIVAAVIFAVGTILSAWLYRRRRGNASFGALVGTMWAMWLWVWPTLMPVFLSQAPYKDLAAQLRALAPEHRAQLRQIAQQDPRIIWYSNVRYPRIIDQLEMLELTGGQRSLEKEIPVVGEAMVQQLEGDDLVLFVSNRMHYILFHLRAPQELAKQDRTMPQTYIWLQARVGRKDRRYIVFGNQAPPWPQPELFDPPDDLATRTPAATSSAPGRSASQPASQQSEAGSQPARGD